MISLTKFLLVLGRGSLLITYRVIRRSCAPPEIIKRPYGGFTRHIEQLMPFERFFVKLYIALTRRRTLKKIIKELNDK